MSRIGASRVTLDTLIGAFLDGCTPEEIAVKYPSLDLANVYAVIAHYLSHQIEIDGYLAERQADAATVRRTIHQSQGTAGVRERLLHAGVSPPELSATLAALPPQSQPHNLGSTGSLSSASTPNTHSWTR